MYCQALVIKTKYEQMKIKTPFKNWQLEWKEEITTSVKVLYIGLACCIPVVITVAAGKNPIDAIVDALDYLKYLH